MPRYPHDSSSKSTSECVRKHRKINDLRDKGRGCCRLLANRAAGPPMPGGENLAAPAECETRDQRSKDILAGKGIAYINFSRRPIVGFRADPIRQSSIRISSTDLRHRFVGMPSLSYLPASLIGSLNAGQRTGGAQGGWKGRDKSLPTLTLSTAIPASAHKEGDPLCPTERTLCADSGVTPLRKWNGWINPVSGIDAVWCTLNQFLMFSLPYWSPILYFWILIPNSWPAVKKPLSAIFHCNQNTFFHCYRTNSDIFLVRRVKQEAMTSVQRCYLLRTQLFVWNNFGSTEQYNRSTKGCLTFTKQTIIQDVCQRIFRWSNNIFFSVFKTEIAA